MKNQPPAQLPATHQPPTYILRLPEVIARVGLSRSQVYALISRGEFPAQIRLSVRTSGWICAEVETWIASRRRVGGNNDTADV